MEITDTQLQDAFEGFLSTLFISSEMTPANRANYISEVRAAFADYRDQDHAEVFVTSKFIELTSRTSYIGYAGNQLLKIRLPLDSGEEVLGLTVVQILNSSRQMMFDYFIGRLKSLDRDEGIASYNAYMDQLCADYGFRNKSALLKGSRYVSLNRNRISDVITFSPTRRGRGDHFTGISADANIKISARSTMIEIAQSLKLALERSR